VRGKARFEAILVGGGLGRASFYGDDLIYASAEDRGQFGRIGEARALEGRKIHARISFGVTIRGDTT
jgi:hypothetical protein